jgi:hypothetical protein
MNRINASARKISIFLTVDSASITKYFDSNDPAPLYCRQLSHEFQAYLNTSVACARRHVVNLLIITLFIMTQHKIYAQSKWVFENYNYWGRQTTGIFVPMIHFETKNNWYAEMRYNYEEVQTISFYGGKTFSGGKAITYSITPLAGFATGRFTGISVAVNTEMDWKNFYVSSQSQYSQALKKDSRDFFFSWSEMGYNISRNVFTGLSMQYTRQLGKAEAEPGCMAGINFKNISVPFYVFNPFNSSCYFVLGLNYEYNLKKRK